MAIAILICRQNAKPGKLAISIQPPSAHDQRVHDRCAYGRNFSERAAKFRRRHMKNFALVRRDPRAGKSGRALQHRNIADEIARARGRENLLGIIPLLERVQFAAEHNRQAEIALARFEDRVPALEHTPLPQRLKQR